MAGVGVVGILASVGLLGSRGYLYAVLFLSVAIAGIALAFSRGRTLTLSLLGATLLLSITAIGRALSAGVSNPLTVILFLAAVAFAWRTYQSHRVSSDV